MSHRVGLVLIVLANVLGGVSYLWQKLAVPGLPPAVIATGRNAVGVVCLYLWARRRGKLTFDYGRADLVRIVCVGVGAFGLPMLLGIIGVDLSTASNGSILILFEPAAILVFARILLGEQIRRVQAGGILLGLVGAWLIVTEDAEVTDLFARDYALGNLLLLVHAVLWGLYTPIIKPVAERHDPVGITLAVMASSMVLMVPAAGFEFVEWTPNAATGTALVYVALLGVLVSFGATVMWTLSLRPLTAGTVAGAIVIQPLAGVLAAVLFAGETLTGRTLAGAIVIAASLALVIAPSRRAAAAVASVPPE